MNFFLKLKNIPELASLTPGQRTEVWARNYGAIFRDPVMILAMLGCALFAGFGSYCGQRFIPWSHGYLVGPFIFFPISYSLFWLWAIERLRPGLKNIADELYGSEEKRSACRKEVD